MGWRMIELTGQKRAHPDLNWGLTDLQSVALPLSYTPIYRWVGFNGFNQTAQMLLVIFS